MLGGASTGLQATDDQRPPLVGHAAGIRPADAQQRRLRRRRAKTGARREAQQTRLRVVEQHVGGICANVPDRFLGDQSQDQPELRSADDRLVDLAQGRCLLESSLHGLEEAGIDDRRRRLVGERREHRFVVGSEAALLADAGHAERTDQLAVAHDRGDAPAAQVVQTVELEVREIAGCEARESDHTTFLRQQPVTVRARDCLRHVAVSVRQPRQGGDRQVVASGIVETHQHRRHAQRVRGLGTHRGEHCLDIELGVEPRGGVGQRPGPSRLELRDLFGALAAMDLDLELQLSRLEPGGHLVEAAGQLAQLSSLVRAGGTARAGGEVTGRDPLRGPQQGRDRLEHESYGEEASGEDRRQDRRRRPPQLHDCSGRLVKRRRDILVGKVQEKPAGRKQRDDDDQGQARAKTRGHSRRQPPGPRALGRSSACTTRPRGRGRAP
jgi:hypothetical protein